MGLTAEKAAAAVDRRVVEVALAIAAERGWDQVRLHAIAERAGLSLAELGDRYRDVDAVANAWFRAARRAMLAVPAEELEGLPADGRIALVLGRWLDHLAPRRGVAGEILRLKLHPSHPHHWVPLVLGLSRLVHDVLDAARVEGAGRRRQAQEVGLTVIVLAVSRDWLRDGSPGQQRTRSGSSTVSPLPGAWPARPLRWQRLSGPLD